jgi:hypothetical protein
MTSPTTDLAAEVATALHRRSGTLAWLRREIEALRFGKAY